MIQSPLLFDTTRMIARSWSGRLPTGIDRVCNAYLRHFGSRAQAVVQHRGVVRILSERHSDELFAMLNDIEGTRRHRIVSLALRAWHEATPRQDAGGAIYLNVSHTDFDLPSHARWVRTCRLRPVYFLHDLIPITHPQYCKPRAVTRHRGRVVGALRTATGIVVNSRSTAENLARFARENALPFPPLTIAPLAVDGRDEPAQPVRRDRPYFLCLGTIEARKNHRLLLEVWLRLIVQYGIDAPRLVIIGQWGARSSAVREMLKRHTALSRYVTLITRCTDREVHNWIAGAEALLMPTLAEGFGLPVVEALASGTPVIASDLPCFRESGGDIPCLLDPTRPADWTQTIAEFSAPWGERQRQLRMLSGYRPQHWEDHFAPVEKWLASLPHWANEADAPATPSHQILAGIPSAALMRATSADPGDWAFHQPHQTAEVRP